MKHRVINGRIYYVKELPAADIPAAKRHISSEMPTPYSMARRFREENSR